MLVFDLKSQGDAVQRVAVIGSCRVRNPLLKLREAGNHDLKWIVSKPPLTHSFNEARQIIRYVKREVEIPDVIAPFIFETARTPKLDGYPEDLLSTVDTVIIEMCDLKQVHFQDFYFQNNYFARNFVRKHANQLLSWYRNFSRGIAISDDVVAQSLGALHAAGVEVTETTEAILRDTRIYSPDAEVISDDAKKLVFDRKKRWIFFSHFSDPEDESTVMSDRRGLAAAIKAAAKEVGAEFFDPSRLVQHYGRNNVLRGDGADIYEYAHEFFPALGHIMCSILNKGTDGNLDLPQYGRPVGQEPKQTKAKSAAASPAVPPTKSEPAATPAKTHVQPTLDGSAEKTNKLLLNVTRERFEALGLERSGLYPYYKRMMDAGSLIRVGDVKVRDLLRQRAPKFHRYTVLKSGVGSLPVLLAFEGFRVTATDSNPYRTDTLRAVMRRLTAGRPAVGRLITVIDWNGSDSSASSEANGLGIATGLVLTPKNQAEYLERLSKFDAVLVEPRRFLGADNPSETVAYVFEKIGLKQSKGLPSANLALFVRG
jgi:hypothetical protein